MLEQPLRQAWAAILRDVGLRLDGLWKSQVAEGFKSNLETKYPFNQQGPDLPLVTLSQYLKPKEGAVWAFYDKELSMFLTLAESRYAPKELFSSQVEFSQAFLDFMSRASAVSRAFFGAGSQEPAVTFDITPDGTHAVTDSLLVIDGVRLLYRNELPLPQSFSWPAKAGTPSHAEFSISVGGTGERPGLPKFDGEWALFRLLSLAQVGPQSPTLYGVTWSIRSSDGRRFDIKYKLQARSVQNPFIPNFFNNVSCPERLSKAPIGGATGGR
jgi:type VI protein secretion system component VasK